jgi:outer membrane protein assembly factor BamB
MEYATGRVLSRFLGRRGCTVATGSVDSIFYRAPEGTVRIEPATGKTEHIAPMRPPCYEGVIVTGGLLHWGAWKCSCPLSLYGNICLAPAGKLDHPPPTDASRLELGPGNATKIQQFDAHPDDWPSCQGDNERTSATKVTIPGQVSREWTSGPFSTGLPTAPVAAGETVFVGDDNGVVRALDAADGTLKWKSYTGGSIFCPPAVWEGRLYLGSADGHVYALEAATGRLLWRFRAAPVQRLIPVYGKLVSTWPVAGGVVVDKGVVYAAAGIAHYDGTHVYALDAVTGQVKWHNGASGRLSPSTNSGVSLQGGLSLAGGQLRFCGGSVYPVASYDLSTGRCVAPVENRVASHARTAFWAYYPDYGQYVSLDHTLPDGKSLHYAAEDGGASHSTLALLAAPQPGEAQLESDQRLVRRGVDPKTKPAVVWEHKSGAKYNSFIVGPDTLLAAGQGSSAGRAGSFLAAIKVENGAELWREELPAPAVKMGTAVDHKARIFASLQDGRVVCWGPSR